MGGPRFHGCAYLGLDCQVYMVKVSYEQKPFRREVMRTYGAKVTPSPSETTEVGRRILAENPGTSGSLGCAISEAVEAALNQEGYRYVLGSVLNQVLLHQSIIGLETKAALDKYGVNAGYHYRLRRARFQPGRTDLALYGRKAQGREGLPLHRRGGPLPAPALPEAFSPMTSAIPERYAPWRRCTPWATPSFLPQTMRAVSAITA